MSVLYSASFGAQVANTTTETSLLVTAPTLPANFLQLSSILRVQLAGQYLTKDTPTLNIRVKVGFAKISSGVRAMPTDVRALMVWKLDMFVGFSVIGNNGFAGGEGTLTYFSTAVTPLAIAIAPTVTFIDTTVPNLVDVTAQWNTADINNFIIPQIQVIEYIPGVT